MAGAFENSEINYTFVINFYCDKLNYQVQFLKLEFRLLGVYFTALVRFLLSYVTCHNHFAIHFGSF